MTIHGDTTYLSQFASSGAPSKPSSRRDAESPQERPPQEGRPAPQRPVAFGPQDDRQFMAPRPPRTRPAVMPSTVLVPGEATLSKTPGLAGVVEAHAQEMGAQHFVALAHQSPDAMAALLAADVDPDQLDWEGMRIILTGRMWVRRDELEAELVARGAIILEDEDVRRAQLVVHGRQAGQVLETARKLRGPLVLPEEDLKGLLGGEVGGDE